MLETDVTARWNVDSAGERRPHEHRAKDISTTNIMSA
jgi:hypothetical protein